MSVLIGRFSQTFYKDKTASDTAQIVAAGASLQVYRQGATCAGSVSITNAAGGVAVSVRHWGALVEGDTVQLGLDDTKVMTVEEITSVTSVKLRSTGSTISASTGDRFLVTSDPPTLYSESTGAVSTTNPATTDSNGKAEFYLNETYVDIVVSGSGIADYLIQDAPGQFLFTGNRYDVTQFASVQDALDTIPDDAILYFPRKASGYTPPDADGWTITKGVTIQGPGELINQNECFRWFQHGATNLDYYDSVVFTIAGGVRHVVFKDVTFSNGVGYPTQRSTTYLTDGTGSAIRVEGGSSVIQHLELDHITIYYAGGNGIHLDGRTGYVVDLPINHVTSSFGMAHGFFIAQATGLTMQNCTATENRLGGLYVLDTANGNIQIETGGCCKDSTDTDLEGHLVLTRCGDMTVNKCNVEGFTYDGSPATPLTVKNGLVLYNCRGCVVQGNEFDNGLSAANASSRGIYLYGDTTDGWNGAGNIGNFIGSNAFSGVAKSVEIGDVTYNYGNIVMPQSFFYTDATSLCRIVLPTGGRNFGFIQDEPSSQFSGQGVGLLLPSVPDHTTIGANVVQDGLLVYNSTTDKLYIRANGAWVIVGTQS